MRDKFISGRHFSPPRDASRVVLLLLASILHIGVRVAHFHRMAGQLRRVCRCRRLDSGRCAAASIGQPFFFFFDTRDT